MDKRLEKTLKEEVKLKDMVKLNLFKYPVLVLCKPLTYLRKMLLYTWQCIRE